MNEMIILGFSSNISAFTVPLGSCDVASGTAFYKGNKSS
jgi:hypothetical protein